MLQSPFNVVTLSIIGDDSATTFFGIDSNTGTINLARSILTDTETSYTVRPAFLCRRVCGGLGWCWGRGGGGVITWVWVAAMMSSGFFSFSLFFLFLHNLG